MGKLFITTVLILTLSCIAAFSTCVAITISAHHQAKMAQNEEDQVSVAHLVDRRGVVSPSMVYLLHNTIAFGVPSVLFFFMRILNSAWVLKKFRLEDYLMCVTFFFYCSVLTFINVSASFSTNLYPTEQEAAILANPADVQNRIMGSMLVIPLEQSMLLSTWGVKTCIWLFLRRLCRQLPKFQFALNCLIAYIWFAYALIQIYYYGIACRPFKQYWAVPVHNEQCATYFHYSIMQMFFNVTSDVALIVIPVVMFSIARLPWKRRALLIGVFSMAIFTIIAATLNKVYNFMNPMTTIYQLWYIREASVAIQVGNIICCWQLAQKVFKVGSFDNKGPNLDVDPEIGARNHAADPNLWSVGGGRKDRNWFAKRKFRAEFLGEWNRSSQAVPTNTSTTLIAQPVVIETNLGELTGATYVNEEEGGPAVTALLTLHQDGDDAGPAIAYRNREDIV